MRSSVVVHTISFLRFLSCSKGAIASRITRCADKSARDESCKERTGAAALFLRSESQNRLGLNEKVFEVERRIVLECFVYFESFRNMNDRVDYLNGTANPKLRKGVESLLPIGKRDTLFCEMTLSLNAGYQEQSSAYRKINHLRDLFSILLKYEAVLTTKHVHFKEEVQKSKQPYSLLLRWSNSGKWIKLILTVFEEFGTTESIVHSNLPLGTGKCSWHKVPRGGSIVLHVSEKIQDRSPQKWPSSNNASRSTLTFNILTHFTSGQETQVY